MTRLLPSDYTLQLLAHDVQHFSAREVSGEMMEAVDAHQEGPARGPP
jgi:hypothetical protein